MLLRGCCLESVGLPSLLLHSLRLAHQADILGPLLHLADNLCKEYFLSEGEAKQADSARLMRQVNAKKIGEKTKPPMRGIEPRPRR